MLRTNLFLIIFVFFSLSVMAQVKYPGKVVITQDYRIDRLIEKHKTFGEKGKQEGYRVQIFFDSGTNSKTRAAAKKGQFVARYPETGAYLTFKSPHYKVRVGDFRCRMDAEGFRKEIEEDFPGAFVVKDKINYPELYID